MRRTALHLSQQQVLLQRPQVVHNVEAVAHDRHEVLVCRSVRSPNNLLYTRTLERILTTHETKNHVLVRWRHGRARARAHTHTHTNTHTHARTHTCNFEASPRPESSPSSNSEPMSMTHAASLQHCRTKLMDFPAHPNAMNQCRHMSMHARPCPTNAQDVLAKLGADKRRQQLAVHPIFFLP